MTILGIAASPRRNGNSEILLDKVLEGASSKGARIEKVVLSNFSIRPCQGCSKCYKDAACVIRDGMQPLYRKLEKADAIVISSPVYFGSITAQLKAMIDRCQPIWVKNFFLKKPRKNRRLRKGIFISVSRFNRLRFFKNSQEIIEILFMVIGVKLFRKLYVSDLENHGEVLKRGPVLEKAFRYGTELATNRRTDTCG
ncbi:MAG: flavodoxin family protein [Candidatus Omnitrophica bacterium]|nr:flavodoxin family protein [Candidatus Omnitrophota bacterium]